jgi:hypothetical protein
LILLPSNQFTQRQIRLLLTVLECFGLTINTKKSRLQPATAFDHLGLRVNLKTRSFSAPLPKVQKLRSAALALA